MNRNLFRLPLIMIAFIAGMGVYHLWQTTQGSVAVAEQKPLYWVAPMDPNYRRDTPGKSPMGMDLVPVYEEPSDKEQFPGTVSVSPAVENNLGVRTEPVSRQLLTPQVQTVGRVAYNEDSLMQLNSRVDGWVENLTIASRGEFVKKGSRLFDLYSPTLVNAQEELLAAIKSGNSALIRASRERLSSLDVPEKTVEMIVRQKKTHRTIPFYTSKDGYISQLNIRDGSYVTPSKTLIELASLDDVWVMADVFERQSNFIEIGQTASMSVDYLPGKTWRGEVDYVYPELDPKTRSLRVRLRFPNPNTELKPNMYSQVRIDTGGFSALAIPAEAVIQTEGQQRVVKALGSGRYRSVRVATGRRVGGQVEILKGLSVGERVVTSAQFLLDSESSINADLSRFEDKDSQPVWVAGKLEKKKQGAVTVTHGPVPEWGWPAMTMDFYLSPDVDVTSVNLGSRVDLQVEKSGGGRYQIIAMKTLEDKPMDHSGQDMGSMPVNHDAMGH
ncbi:efflux RND transporter periplasmic adaptor subunit [Endozoicomonas sp.]|uniref:efflux RND transporter periplasmic adaptor subunit n=1 Tax=Endozoicomonas sp. TaxID=1892382 RepID=UPI002884CB6F|nr:efflux RND transporter periplasmic adaptor subunit [Endozoicomonas sp.]